MGSSYQTGGLSFVFGLKSNQDLQLDLSTSLLCEFKPILSYPTKESMGDARGKQCAQGRSKELKDDAGGVNKS